MKSNDCRLLYSKGRAVLPEALAEQAAPTRAPRGQREGQK